MPWLSLSGSNYPCLERISMVQKMFVPLRFHCIPKNLISWAIGRIPCWLEIGFGSVKVIWATDVRVIEVLLYLHLPMLVLRCHSVQWLGSRTTCSATVAWFVFSLSLSSNQSLFRPSVFWPVIFFLALAASVGDDCHDPSPLFHNENVPI